VKNPKTAYRRLVEFEESAASIYLRLAAHFRSHRKLSWFWVQMALEEKQHAGLLQFCLADSLFAPDLPGEVEIEVGLVAAARKFGVSERLLTRQGLRP